MTSIPLISILTPVYNRAKLIGETADSIFNQNYQNWEWVIVDDGSTDGSWDVLQRIADRDKRVRVFQRHREPKGACTCRNIAADKSLGEYLLFLDSDDLLAPFCLQQRVWATQEAPNHDFIIFPMLLFRKQLDDMMLLWNIDKEEDDLLRVLTGDAICQTSGPLWRRNAFFEIGMWNEELMLWQDVELHIRSFLHPVKYKKRLDLLPDVYLRVSDDSLSRVGYHAPQKLMSRIEVFRYALEEIANKGKLEQYKQGLRAMGADVLISAVNGKLFNEAEKLMRFTEKHRIFSKQELGKINYYTLAYKTRLYKIPMLFRLFSRSVENIASSADISIGTVEWQRT
ncbi:MAG: glycosyltransferase family 2 protein [Candidatus Kuenenia stuttgartiensis]|nr:glycosyltransferase family 2 protein [Candidatus Kuenenia stuttgartiensis]